MLRSSEHLCFENLWGLLCVYFVISVQFVRNDKTGENILMETSALAPIEVESPELKKLIFLARKQRPAEARFMA